MAAFFITLSLTACGAPSAYSDPDDSQGSTSDNIPSSADKGTSSDNSAPDSSSSSDPGSDAISTEPLMVRCGDIITENGKRTFDVEITCGNAFTVVYHYISSENGRIENAIPIFKPLGVTALKDILNDPIIGGGDLSESDFEFSSGVYKMKDEEMAKSLLGSLAGTYSFDQYWKNQKMAELVSTERISAEEARPRVDEMFENMANISVDV